MNEIKKLLLANRVWADEVKQRDPDFFDRLAEEQRPRFLWIGCSDSRVQVADITDTEPGEIFVHRNIANLVVHSDLNMLSVLSYAVNFLHIEHIIVCGHYGCGGVKAAMSRKCFGVLDQWLRPIKDVYRRHEDEVHAAQDPGAAFERMVQLNVLEQVQNVARTSVVQQAWRQRRGPMVHGWVYGLRSGLLEELITVTPETELESIYCFDFDDEQPAAPVVPVPQAQGLGTRSS
jgi:carbonic anhydrase